MRLDLRALLPALAAVAMLAGAPHADAAVPAPRVGALVIRQRQRLGQAVQAGDADAARQVAQARARARAEGKRLLIDLGGNWCPDCRILAGVMALPEVAAFLRRHYVTVYVDVGRLDRNTQIARRYGIERLTGVPAVLVVDPRSDRLLNPGRTFALADARSMAPQALADWLAQWL